VPLRERSDRTTPCVPARRAGRSLCAVAIAAARPRRVAVRRCGEVGTDAARTLSARPRGAGTAAKRVLALVAVLLLAACATPAVRPPPVAGTESCVTLFAAVDDAVARHRVGDAQARRIAGFAHLRVDRLLASFRDALDDDMRDEWLERLAQRDAEARAVELANLPAPVVAALARDHGGDLAAILARCRSRLVAADRADAARLAAVRAGARVPDDYSTARRVVGLYALTRVPFAAGVRSFEREVERVFALPLDALPVAGRVQRFVPAAQPQLTRDVLAARIARAAGNPLRMPSPDAETLDALAHRHAPVYEIDVVDANDRIGQPYWPPAGPARIDTREPVVFYRAAHMRAGPDVLLQIAYTAWFPARPRSGPFDLLAGHLDALIWRVTLAPDGAPILFDSIHGCGCYHFFFPTPHAVARPPPDRLSEWLFVPQALPPQPDATRVVLRVASRSHYLQRVRFAPTPVHGDATYRLLPEDTLRSLPHPAGGRRSLFGPDGFVAGTDRLERFVFWPMGIARAGAMRQWGRHATAFVGRRHFDDPLLLEQRFRLVTPAAALR
jgi:hypothetical protein